MYLKITWEKLIKTNETSIKQSKDSKGLKKIFLKYFIFYNLVLSLKNYIRMPKIIILGILEIITES